MFLNICLIKNEKIYRYFINFTNWKNFPTTFVNGDYSRLFKESAPIKFSSGENNNRKISYLYIEKYNENNNYNNFERLRNCEIHCNYISRLKKEECYLYYNSNSIFKINDFTLKYVDKYPTFYFFKKLVCENELSLHTYEFGNIYNLKNNKNYDIKVVNNN